MHSSLFVCFQKIVLALFLKCNLFLCCFAAKLLSFLFPQPLLFSLSLSLSLSCPLSQFSLRGYIIASFVPGYQQLFLPQTLAWNVFLGTSCFCLEPLFFRSGNVSVCREGLFSCKNYAAFVRRQMTKREPISKKQKVRKESNERNIFVVQFFCARLRNLKKEQAPLL